MPVRLYALLTWTTDARLPRIGRTGADFLRRFLPAEARRQGARVIELGIVRNHVHALLELPSRFDVPRLVQGLKGASARIANREGYAGGAPLRWASGYDLRSVGVKHLRQVTAYVRSQEQRHPELAVETQAGVMPVPSVPPCAEAPARPVRVL
jgi:REP element-mobilizing transposase RayT